MPVYVHNPHHSDKTPTVHEIVEKAEREGETVTCITELADGRLMVATAPAPLSE